LTFSQHALADSFRFARIMGSSRYYDWNRAAWEMAIGYTFPARSRWGGATSAEVKRLMLEPAFRFAGVVRFHVGSNNLRSRRAMEKIGGCVSHEARMESHRTRQEFAFYRIDAPR
jgi:RimJ/RimL family protein N-acetyltransferase